MAVAGRIRVRLKSYDHRVIDEAAAKIVDAVLASGSKIIGPVPLPTDRHLTVVQTSPHVDKNAREHFEMLVHKRMIDIISPNERTIDALSNMDLPAGVSIEVKI
ncbi:MAG: 30S ribosomal protein S10 [Candidatus Blackburnbacteria bacterium RIFCSPHIGHO2_01_FULL_44_64]|uniref:Small ribosomal subunit protein uS10 n=1 Tax=Candidatus Blackburnbacteria bacterium RIFCSPHIGHO2_02_FULL_44_20 TaxID=1797516 RepID=A0A1G1V8V6_9BACT|nr:MAG: 30S ribosomal protein S10 [Candidatus Blackburnbacteria bacterium RIFCSPHIGHO2_01_FULL_44_64]OGY11808.1 MAG: 30S ribosomal protein S10 [Candidatus Blackburnbacteria bacterium RIFCSPHIGHO2_12_FULL_44_25]OGY11855.1 MAG: 30S ribosomal protein S10 [Candidatus Blackburnbacteria bacterium RIFCSPHIGHO2_02_FULL_44_20]OGY14464.1 MAG: 30S ribosomal protein S10 [Candidatus Blackburnbacteria bacterium RIFCSPLOWO2_01_FULL_44_43]OGY15822.1 MAG: 30S ribosomal protein S10 [Candidatus Blackburnbacteria 